MKEIKLYVFCLSYSDKNIGAWGTALYFNNYTKYFSEITEVSDLERVELLAIISTIKHLREACNIDIIIATNKMVETLSKNNLNAIKENNWKVNGENFPNYDLWQFLSIQQKVKKHSIKLKYASNKDEILEKCFLNAQKSIEESLSQNN